MMPLRTLLVLPILLLGVTPAHACWQSPTAACFGQLWQDQTLAYIATGPKVRRLYDLIDWGVILLGEGPARAVLQDVTYDDLVAHHATENDAFGAQSAPVVNPDYLYEIYRLSLATNDRNLPLEWYVRLPEVLRNSPDVLSPDGTPKYPDPYRTAQTAAVSALTHLREGDVTKAVSAAENIQGEPGFLTWRALARHAIDSNDTALLARAVTGMRDTVSTQEAPPFDDEAFERALQAAEAEYAQTGDPDALVHALESADPSAYALPVGVGITVALAQRHLNRLDQKSADDGFDAALRATQRALQTNEDEDDATPMLNARTAMRLGLQDEAERLIAMTDTHFPGVAGFFLYDLPSEPVPWADAWLDRMIARFDHIAANPGLYDTRAYWDIWLEQEALDTAIDIAQLLALYDRRDDAHDFADRATAFLKTLPQQYPGSNLSVLATIFEGETAAYLYPWDVAIPRMRALDMDETLMQYAFANARRPVLALKLMAQQQGYRSLSHWMGLTNTVPAYLRDEYITLLTSLIEEEPARLIAQGYPNLAQALYAEAAVFFATQGDWDAARRQYDQIADTTGKYGPSPAIRNRLVVLRDIARHLSAEPAPVIYPYQDFAL